MTIVTAPNGTRLLYYKGRPVEDLTRSDLLDIIAHMAEDARRTRERHAQDLRLLA